MKNKLLYGYMLVWNEIDILPHNLPHMVENLDKVFVIDGGAQGTSTDGTWEWLQDNYSNHSKVYIETGVYGDNTRENNWNRVMRNRGMELIDTCTDRLGWKHPHWVLSHDADEAYSAFMIHELKIEINNAGKSKVMIRHPYHQFYKDIFHEYGGYNKRIKFLHNLFKYDFHSLGYKIVPHFEHEP